MTTTTLEQSLLEKFLSQAPVEPDLVSTDQDGYTEVQWVIDNRIIQLDIEKDAAKAEWTTWLESDPIEDEPPSNRLDLDEPDTWRPLLELLAC